MKPSRLLTCCAFALSLTFGCIAPEPKTGNAAQASNGSSGGAATARGPALKIEGPSVRDKQAGTAKLCSDKTPFKNCEATDFANEDIKDNPKWAISTWGNANRTHAPENLWIDKGVLVMKVSGGSKRGTPTIGAEISSAKSDFLYGSYRAMLKTAREPGTVNGFFYYLSDKSEIDVEVLSQDNPKKLINFTIHQNNKGAETHQVYTADFDPSADFHEYRFDWTKQGVDYYIDSKYVLTLPGNTPFEPGRMLLNHWTLSSPDWGGGPPVNDALMYVRYIEFYFD
jgi:beta-glucanase (GH16 family)